MYSKALKVVLSVGNDGKLSSCRVHVREALGAATVEQFPSPSFSQRLTAMTLVEDDVDTKQCCVALGSSNGQVILVSIQALDNDTLCYGSDQKVVQVKEETRIYALACETSSNSQDKRRLLVGHATGLCSWDIVRTY
jgi:hypothetical protein